MAYLSKTQPLCRYCGAAIRKHTEPLYCYEAEPTGAYVDSYSGETRPVHVPRHRVGIFRTKAELQKVCNEVVMSVLYHGAGDSDTQRHGRHIWQATTWDGESYVDQYFCSGKHATAFAYLYARHGHGTKAFNDAAAKVAA